MNIREKVSNAIGSRERRREELLPILQEIIKIEKWLTPEVLLEVAKQMELSPADVYGTASFYSFLETKPMGKNVIRICRTISCDMKREKEEVIEAIEEHLHIKMGETTLDGKFTLTETNCLGHCHQGPAMLINDDIFPHLTANSAIEALKHRE